MPITNKEDVAEKRHWTLDQAKQEKRCFKITQQMQKLKQVTLTSLINHLILQNLHAQCLLFKTIACYLGILPPSLPILDQEDAREKK